VRRTTVLRDAQNAWKFFAIPVTKKLGFEVLRRLCGLVFRVPGYRSRGPGFDSRLYQIF
jgi:hypothetical protein